MCITSSVFLIRNTSKEKFVLETKLVIAKKEMSYIPLMRFKTLIKLNDNIFASKVVFT